MNTDALTNKDKDIFRLLFWATPLLLAAMAVLGPIIYLAVEVGWYSSPAELTAAGFSLGWGWVAVVQGILTLILGTVVAVGTAAGLFRCWAEASQAIRRIRQ